MGRTRRVRPILFLSTGKCRTSRQQKPHGSAHGRVDKAGADEPDIRISSEGTMEIDLRAFLNIGIVGVLLVWLMLSLERILNRLNKLLRSQY